MMSIWLMSSNAFSRSIRLDCAWPLLWPVQRTSLQLCRDRGRAGLWYLRHHERIYPLVLNPMQCQRLGGLTVLDAGYARERPGRLYIWRQHQCPDQWRHFHVLLTAGSMGDA